jgi:hypothetical protein
VTAAADRGSSDEQFGAGERGCRDVVVESLLLLGVARCGMGLGAYADS